MKFYFEDFIHRYMRSNDILAKEEAVQKEKLRIFEAQVADSKQQLSQLSAEKQDLNEELLGRTEELEVEQQAREV